jgi:hypothetical protein
MAGDIAPPPGPGRPARPAGQERRQFEPRSGPRTLRLDRAGGQGMTEAGFACGAVLRCGQQSDPSDWQ